jgi:hypothetical protein
VHTRAHVSAAPRAVRFRVLVSLTWLVLAAGCTLVLGGFTLPSGVMLSIGTALLGAGFAAQDMTSASARYVSPMTVYALTLGASAFANAVGLAAGDTSVRSAYMIYAVEEHLLLATQLTFVGLVAPLFAFRLFERSRGTLVLLDSLPRIFGAVSRTAVVRWSPVLAAAVILLRLRGALPSLGTLTVIVELIPHLAAFTLARLAWAENLRRAQIMALAIACAEATRAALFDYLRISVVAPLFAYTLGALLGSRSLMPLRTARFVPIYVAAALVVLYFGTFGEARTYLGSGVSRIAQLQEIQEEMIRDEVTSKQTVLSRLTNFNQLSQVGRVVEEDGFLRGATLEYLGFAFIPRFLWPEKPLIAKGAWFALRIGEANVAPDGRITNSINMTIPGELYLNYDWPGVILGCLLFGALLAALWTRTDFWGDRSNILGSAFGFYVLWVGGTLGADLQILVSLIATYLTFLAISVFLPTSRPRHSRSPIVGREPTFGA